MARCGLDSLLIQEINTLKFEAKNRPSHLNSSIGVIVGNTVLWITSVY